MSQDDTLPTYPLPRPSQFTASFWDACQNEVLEIQECHQCNAHFLPSGPVCPRCWSNDLAAIKATGEGRVFSFVVYRRTYHPAIPAPYVVAIIDLDEGARMVSNIVDCAISAVHIGMEVCLVFENESGFKLPRFKPVTSGDERHD